MELTLIKECEIEKTRLFHASRCPGYDIIITEIDPNTFNYRIVKTVDEKENFETLDEARAAVKKFMKPLAK